MRYKIKFESKYLKNLFREIPFDGDMRHDMQQLRKLENWIINGPGGYMSAIYFHCLKTQYESDYLAILKELEPEKYKEEIDEKEMTEIFTIIKSILKI
ncbi:hypothetical protein KO317_02430 [Candidatus Micrarchaeota archaeon]|nr:hypothetical protein [Candidatus Micrarchaeota archaeon]